MGNLPASRERVQTWGEEIANSVSHGAGALAALIAAPALVISAVRNSETPEIIGVCIFAATLAALFIASTIYHALPRNKAKKIFQMFDRGAIFLLIAGTYTPFTLGALKGPWGWSLLGVVWGLGVAGIALTICSGARFRIVKTILYLAMGWLVIVAIEPLMINIPVRGLLWLLVGGISYTTGVVFYAAKQIRYSHFVWHLFVVAGAVCHFVAVYLCAA